MPDALNSLQPENRLFGNTSLSTTYTSTGLRPANLDLAFQQIGDWKVALEKLASYQGLTNTFLMEEFFPAINTHKQLLEDICKHINIIKDWSKVHEQKNNHDIRLLQGSISALQAHVNQHLEKLHKLYEHLRDNKADKVQFEKLDLKVKDLEEHAKAVQNQFQSVFARIQQSELKIADIYKRLDAIQQKNVTPEQINLIISQVRSQIPDLKGVLTKEHFEQVRVDIYHRIANLEQKLKKHDEVLGKHEQSLGQHQQALGQHNVRITKNFEEIEKLKALLAQARGPSSDVSEKDILLIKRELQRLELAMGDADKNLDRRIDQNAANINDLSLHAQKAEEERKRLEQFVIKHNDVIKNSADRIAALERELKSMPSNVKALSEGQLKELHESVRVVNAQVADLRKGMIGLSGKVDQLDETQQKEMLKISARLEHFEKTLAEYANHVSKRLDDVESALRSHDGYIKELKVNDENLKRHLLNHEQKIEELNKRITVILAQPESFSAQDMESLKAEFKKTVSEVHSFRAQIKALQDSQEEQGKDIGKLRERISGVHKIVNDHNGGISSLFSSQKIQDQEIERLRQEMDGMKKEMSQIQERTVEQIRPMIENHMTKIQQNIQTSVEEYMGQLRTEIRQGDEHTQQQVASRVIKELDPMVRKIMASAHANVRLNFETKGQSM